MIRVRYTINEKVEDVEISPIRFLEMLKEDLEGKISISKAIIGDFELNCIELQNNLVLQELNTETGGFQKLYAVFNTLKRVYSMQLVRLLYNNI